MIKKIALSLIVLPILCGSLNARTFTDVSGKKFEARVISISNDSVSLFIPGSTQILKMPLSKLSTADRQYLKARQKGTSNTASSTQKKANPTSPQKNTTPRKNTKAPTSKGDALVSANSLKEKYRLSDNYLTRLPPSVSIPKNINIRVVSENDQKNRYVYHSPNYEFICDVKLSKTIIQQFSVLFEATREYCRKLPISSMRAHVPGRIKRNRILLFDNLRGYYQNGGIPGSAGVYFTKTNTVMIPLRSLGVKKLGGAYNYDHTQSNTTITHELVHQITDFEYFQHGARGWFSEGIAEYCAATPYKNGQYLLRLNKKNFKEYVTAFGIQGKAGRGLGTTIAAYDLKYYMLQPYGRFIADGQRNYGLSLLITYYFLHMEPDRRNITAFMKALKEGKTGEEALKKLLNGRTFEQLEKDIYKAWKAAGVTINFQ